MKHYKSRAANKVWYGVGVCATLATVAAGVATANENVALSAITPAQAATPTADQAPAKGTFVGNLDTALANIFAGEGGEGGAGLTPMWPSVVAPALTGPEIAKVVTGNTLQLPGHYSYHFTSGHTVDGLYIHWDQLSKASDCPARNAEGSDYYLNPNTQVCWKQQTLPLQGDWSIKDHQLCLDVAWSGGKKEGCRYVTILLDNIALFDAAGSIDGKGHKLLPGKQLAQQ